SYAHELMELLFEAHREQQGERRGRIDLISSKKESWCEQGAAALLMPARAFTKAIKENGVHFATASSLSSLYNTSLLATLVQLVRCSPVPRILMLCRRALKPSQQPVSSTQLSLPFLEKPAELPKKLCVWWAVSNSHTSNLFVPKHKSIPDESCIARAYETNSFQCQVETFEWSNSSASGLIETKRITVGEEPCA